jgi:phospholipid transport system substrate-binding protein
MRSVLPGLLILVLLISPLPAAAESPLDTVKKNVNSVLEVLRNPALQGEANKQAKEQKIEEIAEQFFDFVALSKLTLGRSWRNFNKQQQKEFVSLYRTILKQAYMDRILAYTNEKVVFDREIMLSEDRAEVRTTIITKSAEVPLDYRLVLEDGKWKVYDVIAEGISLVMNYRSQFREILANNPPEKVLKILREKTGKT